MSDLAPIVAACAQSIAYAGVSARISLVFKRRPRGFPRGELQSINSAGERVHSYRALALLNWIARAVPRQDQPRPDAAPTRTAA